MSWPFEFVVLVRHGETEWNGAGRRQGQLDSPLTPNGLRHASDVASSIPAGTVDALFSSPLGRAHKTALIVGRHLVQPVCVLEELAEVHHGTFAGLTNAEIETRYPGELRRRELNKYRWSFPQGESYADGDARAHIALTQVAEAGARTPVLVAHEMIGRMLVRCLLDLAPDQALEWSLPHGVAVKVSMADGTITTATAAPTHVGNSTPPAR